MDVLITCFFALFFFVSIIGIVVRLVSISKKSNNIQIELYDDNKSSVDLGNVCLERLADTSVRSSVRYHKSLYKTGSDFEKYKSDVMKLNLP
jgi:hypothetical protein